METTDGANTPITHADAGAALPIARLPFPVLKLGTDGIVLESNGALEAEWGLPTPLRGRPLADVLQPHTTREIAALLRTLAAASLVLNPRGDGHRRTFAAVPDGTALWLVGEALAYDAQREALEEAQRAAEREAREYARVSRELRQANQELEQRAAALTEATEAKARFLATMSHELRTPLNAVLGYAGLMRDGVYGPVSEPQDRAVRSIVRRARDLQLLIDDVLDLSKIEAGRAELRTDEFEPAAVLAEVQEAIAPSASQKGVTIHVHADFRDAVRLDRVKYRQVVLNLATNAVKFTPQHGRVTLSVERGGDDQFMTCVSDTGIGIAREDLPRIFENFQQLDSGSTRRYQGLGLGLPIVRRIVDLLGGVISVDSELGRGTTFRVRLPSQPAQDMMLSASGDVVPESPRSEDPIVLAIDDDPEVIALLRDSLAPAHFRVVGALNGDRGKELARVLRPLAITLDIMMPEKDGWQVLREIKADPELAQIPVIAMSIVSERSLGFSLGVTDYLVKPVDRRVLIGVLERLRTRGAPHSALVVDDDYDARTLMHDLLTSLRFAVRVASNGREAIEALARSVPEVLFVDVGMREEDVSLVLDAVSREKRYERVRTVLVTRSDVASEHQEWLRRASAAVVYQGQEQPEALLRELRLALAAIGAAGTTATSK